ncbi:SMAD/FHA domain-containing protein [Roridomyces roridus]|uniref:SMAD/FHA domain-containing protein n=1 Tax=Roridomyces roridus TaxID=1738132 RepID=A0AAD7FKP2_9AGAR|nr:SMAD/FHA domain-containing protein [Roridomyces roridus]
MPAPILSTSPAFPALYLYPLNDSFFIPKQIALTTSGRRVQLGRKSSKTPLHLGKKQVDFDSSVVSRVHAEVWQEGGKIFIRDLQSSNGTFLNGRRLSPEGHPHELKTNDVLELGIDITGYYDTIAHQKIACRVVCVFTRVEVAMVAMADSRGHRRGYSVTGSILLGNS